VEINHSQMNEAFRSSGVVIGNEVNSFYLNTGGKDLVKSDFRNGATTIIKVK